MDRSSEVLPVTEAELFLTLLFVHSTVAVQVIEASAFLPPLCGGGARGLSVLFALLGLDDGGDVFASVARDVGHVLTTTRS